jgi:hypothetical protein
LDIVVIFYDVCFAGEVVKPSQVGILSDQNTREDKEPFLAGFFKSSESPEGNILHAKKAKRAVKNGNGRGAEGGRGGGGKKKKNGENKSHNKRSKLYAPVMHSFCFGRQSIP